MAGFDCICAIEIDPDCCATLRLNRPHWPIIQADMREVDGRPWEGADLYAAGVPCPPFSVAGKQLGADDDRDMFPSALKLIAEIHPRAVLLENVPGFASAKFSNYRKNLLSSLEKLGYEADWRILEAADFGVAQLRPRFLLVAMKPEYMRHFFWPEPSDKKATVGEVLFDLMSSNGWKGVHAWAKKASAVAQLSWADQKNTAGQISALRARNSVGETCTLTARVLLQKPPIRTLPLISCRALLFAWSPVFRVFQTHGNSTVRKQLPTGRLGTLFLLLSPKQLAKRFETL